MTAAPNLTDIELAEMRVDEMKSAYLRSAGQKHTCQTPGSYWLWEKTLPDGRIVLIDYGMALQMQSRMAPPNDEADAA